MYICPLCHTCNVRVPIAVEHACVCELVRMLNAGIEIESAHGEAQMRRRTLYVVCGARARACVTMFSSHPFVCGWRVHFTWPRTSCSCTTYTTYTHAEHVQDRCVCSPAGYFYYIARRREDIDHCDYCALRGFTGPNKLLHCMRTLAE